MFENSVPGLPERAAEEGLDPLAYMRKYGVFEIKTRRLRRRAACDASSPTVELSEHDLSIP